MERKICSHCKQELDLNCFGISKKTKKYNSWCKQCLRENSKKWYRNNIEKAKKDHKDYYYNNIEYFRDHHQQWYAENSDKVKKQHRQYYNDNKEKLSIKRMTYYSNNKDEISKSHKEYYEKNRKTIREKAKNKRKGNIEESRRKEREYQRNNKDKVAEWHKNYRESHKEQLREYNKKYRELNKDKINKAKLERLHNDQNFKLKEQTRNMLRHVLRSKGHKKESRTKDIVGCDLDFLCEYLFDTWEKRYGKKWNGEPFHIDHIVPISTAKTEEDIIKLCHYTNLQLLTPEDNMEKSDKLDW